MSCSISWYSSSSRPVSRYRVCFLMLSFFASVYKVLSNCAVSGLDCMLVITGTVSTPITNHHTIQCLLATFNCMSKLHKVIKAIKLVIIYFNNTYFDKFIYITGISNRVIHPPTDYITWGWSKAIYNSLIFQYSSSIYKDSIL